MGLSFGACSKNNSTNQNDGGTGTVTFKQIERVARPAINEGLITTNAYLNAFNSIPPSADLSPAAAPVVAEAGATLTAFAHLGGDVQKVPAVVAGFLPDVMRIDTSVSIPPGTTAYNACLPNAMVETNPPAILCGGRKLEDDVMDVTLSYLVFADPTGAKLQDQVYYAGAPASSPDTQTNQGHHKLYGQTVAASTTSTAGLSGTTYANVPGGAAQFPYLAVPN